MTALLRDSTNPANIPAGTTDVGGYVDGQYGLGTTYWNAAAWARWKATGARLRRIAAVTVNTPSNTSDCERFDLGAADVPVWWKNMRALGEVDLWAYCSRNQQHAVEDDCWNAGIPLNQLSMWIATLDGTLVVARYRYPIAAVQYVDRGPYDESVVYKLPGGQEMLIQVGNGNAYVVGDNGKRLISASELFVWIRAQGPATQVSQQEADAIPNVPTSGGGVEPPEPAEPKTISLTIPSVPGTATGTIS